MPYHKRIIKKGKRESPFAHFIKLLWFLVKYNDIYDEITLTEFCKKFEEIVVSEGLIEIIERDYDLTWTFYNEDGTICKPVYDTISEKWRHKDKYGWEEFYPYFKADRLRLTEDSEREKYIRRLPVLNKRDYRVLDRCAEKNEDYTEIEIHTERDMTYYRNKNNETSSNVEERLRKRNGFNIKVEVNGEVNSKVNISTSKDFFSTKEAYKTKNVKKLLFDDEK